jgi:hypothetical protein
MKQFNFKTPTISIARKLIASAPFFIAVGLVANTSYELFNDVYEANPPNYVTPVLLFLNGVLYPIRFKPALLATGAILVLATFNLLPFFPGESYISIAGLTFPFRGSPFPLLVFYCVINFDILINWKLDAKARKPVE